MATRKKKKVPRPMWKELSTEDWNDETARGLARRTNEATLLMTYRHLDRAMKVVSLALYYAREIDGKRVSE